MSGCSGESSGNSSSSSLSSLSHSSTIFNFPYQRPRLNPPSRTNPDSHRPRLDIYQSDESESEDELEEQRPEPSYEGPNTGNPSGGGNGLQDPVRGQLTQSPSYLSRPRSVSNTTSLNNNSLPPPPEYRTGPWHGTRYRNPVINRHGPDSSLDIGNRNNRHNTNNNNKKSHSERAQANNSIIQSNPNQASHNAQRARNSQDNQPLPQEIRELIESNFISGLAYGPSEHHSSSPEKKSYSEKDPTTTTDEKTMTGARLTEQDLNRFKSRPPTVDYTSDTEIDGQSFDDYDWENDDDLEGDVRFDDLNEEKAEAHHHRRRTLARRFSPYNIVKALITTFIGNIILSIIFIIPPVVLRLSGYYDTDDDQKGVDHRFYYDNISAWMVWLSFNLMSSWALHFLTELAPRIFVSLVSIIWGDVHESIKTQVETFHTYKTWLKVLFYSAMAWGSWEILFAGFYHLHSHSDLPSRARYTDIVRTIAQLCFFFMLVLCIEKFILMSISMRFHRVAYSDRIQRVTKALAAIDTLQDYRPKRKYSPRPPHSRFNSGEILSAKGLASAIPSPLRKSTLMTGNSADTKDNTIKVPKRKWWQRKLKPSPDTIDPQKGPGNPELSPPISGEKMASPAPQSGEFMSPGQQHSFQNHYPDVSRQPDADEKSRLRRKNSQTTFATFAKRGASAAKIARAAMKDPVAVVGKKSGLGLDVNNPTEARKLARRIYFSLKTDPNRHYLIPSDFYPAFPNRELAQEAFSIFDFDGNGDISRTEVKNEIFRVYKERRALTHSLQDVGHAISNLDGILMALGSVVFVFIALSVTGIDFSKALTSVYTVGIAAAFIFKETAGNVFDAIIMVFCTHPYDTGDRIIMDNNGVDEVLVVKRMGLLATVFSRWDGTEWFAPNSLLGQKFIINLRRSSNQFENVTVQFGWDTPLEKLDALEEKMNLWLQTDEQRRFEPGTACAIQKLVNQQYMEITIGMTHRENWQDWGGRWNRRTAFHAAVNYYSQELGITFYRSEQPLEIKNWGDLKERILIGEEEGPYRVDDDFLQGEEGEEYGDQASLMGRSIKSGNVNKENGTLGKAPAVEISRMPELLGFSAPPESGTGMRKRKKLSKKKAMIGDA